jgi:hypothetical protein
MGTAEQQYGLDRKGVLKVLLIFVWRGRAATILMDLTEREYCKWKVGKVTVDVNTQVRHGVIVLAPAGSDKAFAVRSVTEGPDEGYSRASFMGIEEADFDNPEDALIAARDALGLLAERRTGSSQDNFIGFARRYVRKAEKQGRSRREVVDQLVAMLERSVVNAPENTEQEWERF